MAHIEYAGLKVELQAGESVLDALLRGNVQISHSCKAGVCQSCLLQAPEQSVPEKAQEGLKDTLKAQGYFLACACYPSGNLVVCPPAADLQITAKISGLELLSNSVLRVLLTSTSTFTYRSGQFVTLVREDGLSRSYSLASLPQENRIELHVRKVNGGAMSGWLHDGATADMTVRLRGPAGQCFYVSGTPEQPLLLAGTGTGLAPLYGIARDALLQGHTGAIWLFHGAVDTGGLYLVDELRGLSRTNPNFQYVPAVLQSGGSGEAEVGALDDAILSRFPKLSGWKGYVCGDPGLVNSLRKKFFLAGMASRQIYADPFLPSAA